MVAPSLVNFAVGAVKFAVYRANDEIRTESIQPFVMKLSIAPSRNHPTFGPMTKSSLIFWTILPAPAVGPFNTPFRNNRRLVPSNVNATCTVVPGVTAFEGEVTHLVVPPIFTIADI